MYGFNDYIDVTPEQLISSVNQKQVFEILFGYSIDLEEQHISPFREDTKPGCFFETREDGTLIFVDFAERKGKTHRSCISAVMDKYNLSLSGAMQFICGKLHIESNQLNNSTTIQYNKSNTNKSDFHLTYQSKDFTKKDIIYWSNFLITIKNLKEDNVFSVKSFTTQSRKGVFKFTPNLCYAIDFIDAIKIYQPYKEGKGKWITNCNENHIGNIDNLPPQGEELIITKSYKDHRVLRNVNTQLNVIWFQNEGCVPDEYILNNLLSRFRLITIFFDNDKSGVEASYKLKDTFELIRKDSTRVISLPKKKKHKILYGKYLKDPAEFINKEGTEYLKKTLKQIGINGKIT